MNHAFLPSYLRTSFRYWLTSAVTEWGIPRPRDDLAPVKTISGDQIRSANSSCPPPVFVRQGDWVFVPAPEVDSPQVIHWCAPLLCAGPGAPHVVAELARGHPADPTGLFARGAVRHPDHATIYLAQWHRVYLSGDPRTLSELPRP